jgi:XXXCH domain-containing protein
MTSKRKYNWRFSRSEAADLLRRLADTLEDGSDEVGGYGVSLAELIKFKIKIDLSECDFMEVKFTGKGEKVCGSEDSCGSSGVCEKYTSLKKRMQVYFKAMRESVAAGNMPSREIVSVFLSDSEKMVSYQGFGDEFYGPYMQICQRLREAVDADDQALTAAAVSELAQARKSCHERYK